MLQGLIRQSIDKSDSSLSVVKHYFEGNGPKCHVGCPMSVSGDTKLLPSLKMNEWHSYCECIESI